MFRDKVVKPTARDIPPPPPTGCAGTIGKKIKLTTNSFKLTLLPNSMFYHYVYALEPDAKSMEEECWVVAQIWEELKKNFGTFIVSAPGQIFSPSIIAPGNIQLPVKPNRDKGWEAHKVTISLHQTYSAEFVNSSVYGEAKCVLQHIVKRLCAKDRFHKVGRRHMSSNYTSDNKKLLNIISGFQAALHWTTQQGPLLQLDMLHQPMQRNNILKEMKASFDGEEFMLPVSDDQKADWERRCTGAVVVTEYNNRSYRVKRVRFDMNANSSFRAYLREEKRSVDMTIGNFYSNMYHKKIEDQQPLLEAYPEKDSQQVFLVPELCQFTGFNEDLRKDKTAMGDALKLTKASPQERLAGIKEKIEGWAATPSGNETKAKVLDSWKFSLDKKPLEVEARAFDQLEVKFGTKNPGFNSKSVYLIEEGNFQRWMRNGVQCPTKMENWLFIYPETDQSVIEIWLRSLMDIAQVAFSMIMKPPFQITCTDQRANLLDVLAQHLKPTTQMVLLLTPQKDARRVYNLFKEATCLRYPCITQVVKSETVRKRQAIAAVLSRIVLQINAKSCGPLWHIEHRGDTNPETPLFVTPTMLIGIDIYRHWDGEQTLGFVASIDTQATEYFSTAFKLNTDNVIEDKGIKIQQAFRDAIVKFIRWNGRALPDHIVVYRASVSEDDWASIRETEIEGINRVLRAVRPTRSQGDGNIVYAPNVTFVAITKRVNTRFFSMGDKGMAQGAKNPEPGTVIDSKDIARKGVIDFFLINQAATKGTACPTHYTVLYQTGNLTVNALQHLSYRLSFLYFNHTGSVRMPAPAQYAKKIAHFIGTAVRQEPHQRLLGTFFYL